MGEAGDVAVEGLCPSAAGRHFTLKSPESLRPKLVPHQQEVINFLSCVRNSGRVAVVSNEQVSLESFPPSQGIYVFLVWA